MIACCEDQSLISTSRSPCQEKALLLKQYSQATHTYALAVAAYSSGLGKAAHDLLHQASEQARLDWETARVAFGQHKHEHGCL
jgi:hypothetical protein